MPFNKLPLWASLLAFFLLSFAAYGADHEASLMASLLRVTFHLPSMFEGRGHHKAAFLVFATPTDVRSPAESIEKYKILRDLGVTIDGFYLEAEHTGLNPETSHLFVTLAEQNGFRVMVRPPSLSPDSVKAWNSLGHSGLVVPLTNSKETIDSGFAANYYIAGRPIGYEADTRMLTAGSSEDLAAVDGRRTLAFMIEDYSAAESIGELLTHAANRAKYFNINPKHVAFWFGPYDMAASLRLALPSWSNRAVDQYMASKRASIASAVVGRGFTMGGHVPDGDAALARITEGWSAFTIDGMYSENLFSAKSVRERFGAEAVGFLEAVRQPRVYTAQEQTVVLRLLSSIANTLGCGAAFDAGKASFPAPTEK